MHASCTARRARGLGPVDVAHVACVPATRNCASTPQWARYGIGRVADVATVVVVVLDKKHCEVSFHLSLRSTYKAFFKIFGYIEFLIACIEY